MVQNAAYLNALIDSREPERARRRDRLRRAAVKSLVAGK
jgi:hypothetical protein